MTALLLFFFDCTPPPPLHRDEIPPLISHVFPEDRFSAVAAFGDVRISVEGEVHRAEIEVTRDTAERFSADFYGPLGIVVGSIQANDDRGTVTFDEGAYTFTMVQRLDTPPFTWLRGMTFGEIIQLLTGRIPDTYASLMRRLPDSCIDEKKTITALWKTDTLDGAAALRKKGGKVEWISFHLKKSTPFLMVTVRSIKKGRAHKIELRENDNNYFSIKYRKLKCY